jgi:hypothetical protein
VISFASSVNQESRRLPRLSDALQRNSDTPGTPTSAPKTDQFSNWISFALNVGNTVSGHLQNTEKVNLHNVLVKALLPHENWSLFQYHVFRLAAFKGYELKAVCILQVV